MNILWKVHVESGGDIVEGVCMLVGSAMHNSCNFQYRVD